MTSQLTSSTVWPPNAANTPGQNIKIKVTYPFRTFLAVFWTGAGGVNDSGVFNLGASSMAPIQF
jgi:hypothetical protein